MRFQSVAFALAAHVLVGVSAAPFNIVNDVAKRECLALDSDGNGCQPLISDPAKNITKGVPMTHRCIEVVRDACVRWEPPLPDTHPVNTTTVPKCLEYIEGGCSRWDPPLKPINRTQLPTCVEHAKNGTDGLKGECTRWDPPIQCRRLPDGKCDFMGLGPVVLKNHTEPQIKCPKKLPDGKCDWMGLGPVELNRTLDPFRDCRTIYRGECIRFGEPLPRLNETQHLNHTLPIFHPLVGHLPEEAGSSTATTTAAAPTATATGTLTDEVSDTKRNVLPGVDFVARSPAGDVSKRTNIATNTLTEACPDKDGHCRILPQ